MLMFLLEIFAAIVLALLWVAYQIYVVHRLSPLRNLPGPEVGKGLFMGGHLGIVQGVSTARFQHEESVKKYGKNIKIKGIGIWEDRLLTTDPVAMTYVLNHPNDYQKPWQSRRVITRLIGEGMLAAEGQVHKRMRRVGTPAFSVQNMRALVPVVYGKAQELKDKWNDLIDSQSVLNKTDAISETGDDKTWFTRNTARFDVCHWISRATFDVIGLAGFDYDFHAIERESNELFLAYKDMFEIAVSRAGGAWDIAVVYFPWLERIFPDEKTRIVKKSQEIINRVGRQLVQEKKRRILDGEKNGTEFSGIDLLSLLLKSNLSTDISPNQRISDEEILHNVNTFLFAGSDTTSLALTWTFYLLAAVPSIQERLRAELQTLVPSFQPSALPDPRDTVRWQELWNQLDGLPYLQNVIRESLRLIPPVHSSIRVAMKDDEIPTGEAVRMNDGNVKWGVKIKKGQLVHIPVESMNIDKSVWGDDAWYFKPDRWDKLPSAVYEQPGLFANLLTFSAGPRSCIGMRFSMIEMKSFIFVLLTNFSVSLADDKVFPANVVLTRPYVRGKFMEGSQCPLLVTRLGANVEKSCQDEQTA